MKILLVTQYFWPENFRINDLAQGLRNRGLEVALTPDRQKIRERDAPGRVPGDRPC